MNENIFEVQYDVTKKSKFKRLYEKYKILVITFLTILIVLIISLFFYLEFKEKKRISITNNYIKAKIYLDNKEKQEATTILKELVFNNDSTYSTLSFFLIINENLITDEKQLSNLFDHILENNKFDNEIKNLIIFKRLLFKSNFSEEHELLEAAKPILNTETAWKPHALLLIGDYFISKKENLKAKEFYKEIMLLKNLHMDFYYQANSRLALIENDQK